MTIDDSLVSLPDDLNKEVRFEATVPVIITPQARKVLSQTKYSEQDFLSWAVKQITFGGGNVISFLEQMASNGSE